MLEVLGHSRRRLLQVGAVGMTGLSLPNALRGASSIAPAARAKACILLYMDGGPSHIDLWDLKPEAPAEVRGPYKPIATSVPGIHVCEHLPQLARQMHRITQIRSVCHQQTIHDPAVYQMLTGYRHPIPAGGLVVEERDFPTMGAAFHRVDRRPAVMPKVVQLPETMKMSSRILPGQNAGFLGATYEPFHVEVTAEGNVIKPQLGLASEMTADRLGRRASLVERFNHSLVQAERRSEQEAFDLYHQQALSILATPAVQGAFDIENEPTAVREAYGLHRHGQSVLLARRLVEAGARFVTVYWGKENQDWADGKGMQLANNPWDTHRNHFPLVKDELLPRADQTFAALLEDLATRGLLDDTLVVWMGDFGRTPRITKPWASRDHWPFAFTVLFAGAGCPAGSVYGKTDSLAAHVTENPVSPADLTATIFRLLGVDPQSPIRSPDGLVPISAGNPISALVS